MSLMAESTVDAPPTHNWLRKLNVSYSPGPLTTMLRDTADNLVESFAHHGHQIQRIPDNKTDLILTTAAFGQPVNWRESLFFNARRRFKLKHLPTVCTLIHITPAEFQQYQAYLEKALDKERPEPADYPFPGIARNAHKTLFEQGRRGGPILALERLLQAQSKCVRIILFVGDDWPIEAYSFDLVGAHPRTANEGVAFYDDLMLRLVTALSSPEIAEHKPVGDPISNDFWRTLSTPSAMNFAGQQLMARNFFTEMVRIADLVDVPALNDAIASQFSEGCYGTWDSRLDALVSTITGSARPVRKGQISDDELAVVVGVRADRKGARYRCVEGLHNSPPSSEAVEMIDVDTLLPRIRLAEGNGFSSSNETGTVPVIRSKLHGHRGVAAYDPEVVEFVALDRPYYSYPVSCGTAAQAGAIKTAFARSKSLLNVDDPRRVIFSVLPGHGVFIAEKWVTGKVPFQVIWEFIDSGALQIDSYVPNGMFTYVDHLDGIKRLSLD